VLLWKENLPSDFLAKSESLDLNTRFQVVSNLMAEERQFGLFMEMYQFFVTTTVLKSLFPATKTSNLDLGGDENEQTLNRVVQIGASLLGENIEFLNKIRLPQPEESLIVPLLAGVPPQELLTIREKEKLAIDSFRHKLQKKLIEMRATIGSTGLPYIGLFSPELYAVRHAHFDQFA
jgi:hypothetical protein